MNTEVLREVVEPVGKWNPRSQASGDITYIELSSVSQELKQVVAPVTIRGSEAPSRARQLIATDDVLVSTVRPNLNAVAHVPPELDGATASTGFTVLRPDGEKLASRYLLHWVQSPQFIGEMVRLATGASYPAVSDRIVMNSVIPLPPLSEQRRIAAILDKADELRQKRREAIEKLDSLTQSVFHDLLGPLADAATRPLEEAFGERPVFGTMNPGSARGDWLDLRVANIQDGRLDLGDRKYVELSEKDRHRHTVTEGDLLLARAIASEDLLGKCVVVDPKREQWAFDSHLMRIRLRHDRMLPEFLKAWLATPYGRAAFLRVARRSSVQFNVNTKEMSRLPVPVVDVALQHQFTQRLGEVEVLRSVHVNYEVTLAALAASLRQRAFRGGL